MKILTVKQPWAYLLIHGAKNFENRSWNTEYRGPVAIHAGLEIDTSPRGWALAEEAWANSSDVTTPVLVKGKIIGTAELVDVIYEEKGTRIVSKWFDGPYGWEFRNKQPLKEPIPCQGAPGLRDLDPAISDLLLLMKSLADG